MSGGAPNAEHAWLRAGDESPAAVRRDVCILIGCTLLLIATGVGLRDPWPADEPRFALIARDMALTGEWLIPQVGGDLYQDKPPLFFWIVGAIYWLTGSLRTALLLPGVLAGVGCVLLTYDLARRLWDRSTGLVAGLALLVTVQFVWQMRQGQIDATLCFFTTLSLYALLRCLLLGPAPGWYVVGWAAAGLGVITKGVGFLPLLTLVVYAAARWRGWTGPAARQLVRRWWLGPVAMLGALAIWLAPMLVASFSDPAIGAYRDEILFEQTLDRYAAAPHHREPFWYFILQVIPALWLPLTLLIPWMWRSWRAAWRARDLRTWLPLAWTGLVVLFFSLSTGKRGVYVLPALPAFVLACAPYLRELLSHRGAQRALFILAAGVGALTGLAGIYLIIEPTQREALAAAHDIDAPPVLFAMSAVAALICAAARPARGSLAYAGVLTTVLLIVSFWVNPAMNEARSGERFMRLVQQQVRPGEQLGLVAYKEQYLLYLDRPITNFGHRRWREYGQEIHDAAAWLEQEQDRVLLVDRSAREACFNASHAREVGVANRSHWFLVTSPADPACAAKGDLRAARVYTPPTLHQMRGR